MFLASYRRRISQLARLRRFVSDINGVAAVEFAMVLPVMVVMYLGMAEVSQGVGADRKVTLLSRALADLTAQSKTVTAADMNGVFAAAAAVLTPYSDANAQLSISSIEVDAGGVARVAWSYKGVKGANWSCASGAELTPGSTITLPEGLAVASTSLIMAQVTYPFTPTIGYVLSGTIDLAETTYMRPRLVAGVPGLGDPQCS